MTFRGGDCTRSRGERGGGKNKGRMMKMKAGWKNGEEEEEEEEEGDGEVGRRRSVARG